MILQIALCVLAAYGIFNILSNIYMWLLTKDNNSPLQYILIVTKNNEDTTEYCIRSALKKLPYGFEDVLIMDMESTDGTKEIINHFEKDGKIKVVHWKQFNDKV